MAKLGSNNTEIQANIEYIIRIYVDIDIDNSLEL